MFFSTKINTLDHTVRWDHTATPGSNELTVNEGDQVIIIIKNDETGWYMVGKIIIENNL